MEVSLILQLQSLTGRLPQTCLYGSEQVNGDMHGGKRIYVVIHGRIRVISLCLIIYALIFTISLPGTLSQRMKLMTTRFL